MKTVRDPNIRQDNPEPTSPSVGGAVSSFAFSFCIEQRIGAGEDAEPFMSLLKDQKKGAIAVFDGMGGAGSSIHRQNGVSHTGAYIAARLAREVVQSFFLSSESSSFAGIRKDSGCAVAASLEDRLKMAFKAEIAKIDPNPSLLSSKMIRRLPTTMACIAFELGDEVPSKGRYAAFWAGDSRAYILSPIRGLQQITVDDIKSGGDALENLLEDAPMSNCINSDTPFVLHVAIGEYELPACCIVATDGCFNFVRSPAHFEFVILDALSKATTSAEWKEWIIRHLGEIAGDDLSMAAVSMGWPDFLSIKDAFAARHQLLRELYVAPLDSVEARLAEVKAEQARLQVQRDSLRLDLWSNYKKEYGALMLPAENRGPTAK